MDNLTEHSEPRTCQNCGHTIRGRSDKKFCSDGCRNAVNNRLNAASNNTIRNIKQTLLRNRRILCDLMSSQQNRSLTISELVSKGFRMEYHTEIIKIKRRFEQVYCFDYGYQVKNDNTIKIVRK